MNKIVFIALLVIGIVLLVLGVTAYDSVKSDFSRFFTGEPTDKAIWLLVGGGLSSVIGLGGMLRGGK
jgi:hypothetical protein